MRSAFSATVYYDKIHDRRYILIPTSRRVLNS